MLMVSTTPDEYSQVFMVMEEDVSKSVVCVRERQRGGWSGGEREEVGEGGRHGLKRR